MSVLRELLDERGFLLIDGAMGTELFARGLESGGAPELWNIEHPERVRPCTTTTSRRGPTSC